MKQPVVELFPPADGLARTWVMESEKMSEIREKQPQ